MLFIATYILHNYNIIVIYKLSVPVFVLPYLNSYKIFKLTSIIINNIYIHILDI